MTLVPGKRYCCHVAKDEEDLVEEQRASVLSLGHDAISNYRKTTCALLKRYELNVNLPQAV